MNHTQKVKLARKIRTHRELVEHVPIFHTLAWTKRAEAIATRYGAEAPKYRWEPQPVEERRGFFARLRDRLFHFHGDARAVVHSVPMPARQRERILRKV